VVHRNNQLDADRKTDPNVRINLDPKVAADIYCKFVPSKNIKKQIIPHGIASNLLLVYAKAILNKNCEILLYDNNIDNHEKLVFSNMSTDVANVEKWSFGDTADARVELDNFYDMQIEKDPSLHIVHSPNESYAEYCKLKTNLLKPDSINILPPPHSVDLTSKAKKHKPTSHGAGKTKKKHKHKRRNTRKN
jgi:hypothetical protein